MKPQKLHLPRLQRVELRRFSLFTANPDAAFDTGDGVLCLVGANGVGKSTLLSAINYCITGTVPDPARVFESMEEYYKFTRTYSGSYFRGRITASDADDAEIKLRFSIGEFTYEVCRGMFETEELRSLRITQSKDGKEVAVELPADLPRGERHTLYTDFLVQHVGVSSFEEFVFLQHFVFTFDEQRKTLFWNPRIMERVLFRAFGFDANMAKQADSMRREMQHEDSRVRNYQWESTRMRKRINEIRAQAQATSGAQQQYDTLVSDHQRLSELFDQESKEFREAQDALKDAHVRLAECSVRENALRDEYAMFFERRFDTRPPLSQHPLVTKSLTEKRCGLCGTGGDKAQNMIEKKIAGKECPLCNSELNTKAQKPGDLERLREIDAELLKARQLVSDAHKAIEQVSKVEEKVRVRWESTKEQLDTFDRANTSTLESLRGVLSQNPGQMALSDYRQQLALLEKDKNTAYEKREDLKKRLHQLKRNLEAQYIQVETTFVPTFSSLAQHFLGMPLTVTMDASPTADVSLVVSVRGTTRRDQQHLSESQRFFLDIALRMALTQHMSAKDSRGGMFIDTPEGSLDIAYEKRAGEMLAKFVLAGHQLTMTANLNSSKLLLALARNCGSVHMRLCRITDWAELSEVQQQEEGLFDEAYADIEKAMAEFSPT